MADKKFNKGYVLSTGSIVRIDESSRQGIHLSFINPLLSPGDLPCATETDDDRGRVTHMRLSVEAAVNLMVLLREYVESKYGSTEA